MIQRYAFTDAEPGPFLSPAEQGRWVLYEDVRRFLNPQLPAENGGNPQLSSMLAKRMDYWRGKDLRSGWTGSEGGPCCEKCRMTSPKDPLQALVGCRDPFQINCECHIPSRRAVRDYMLIELEGILNAAPQADQSRGRDSVPVPGVEQPAVAAPVLKDGQLIRDSAPIRK